MASSISAALVKLADLDSCIDSKEMWRGSLLIREKKVRVAGVTSGDGAHFQTSDVLRCAQDSCVNELNILNKRTEELQSLNKYQIAVIINFLKLQDTASPQSEFGKVKLLKLFNKTQLQKNWSQFPLGDQSLRRKWI